ncbi:hypothetical protein GCM10008933_06290 [Paenibacillus motobuensis]|uniref:Uncharacterized protein n=1 Tax=Paenibacillus motobuensis TaxID=295324 RepID=A0ABP3HT59_9BACL
MSFEITVNHTTKFGPSPRKGKIVGKGAFKSAITPMFAQMQEI